MNKNLRKLVLVFAVIIAGIWNGPVYAGGSFYDTIQGAGNGNSEKAIANNSADSPTFTPQNQSGLKLNHEGASPTLGKPTISLTSGNSPVTITFGNAIQDILNRGKQISLGQKIIRIFLPTGDPINIGGNSWNPGNRGGGSGGVFYPPGTKVPGTKTPGTSTGTIKIPEKPKTPQKPGTPGNPTKPPYDPPVATTPDGLKGEMASKYGVTPVDGESKWTEAQLKEAMKVLGDLPDRFRSFTKKIVRDKIFKNNPRILGYVRMGIPTVTVLDGAVKNGLFARTIAHELTHCFQAANKSVAYKWESAFWQNGKPKPPSVTSYGNTEPLEDMAESVAEYYMNGGRLKSIQPDRYAFIKNYIMDGHEF